MHRLAFVVVDAGVAGSPIHLVGHGWFGSVSEYVVVSFCFKRTSIVLPAIYVHIIRILMMFARRRNRLLHVRRPSQTRLSLAGFSGPS